MDLDAIFSRPDKSLHEMLDPRYDLYLTTDIEEEDKINTGFFVLRTSEWSRDFLERVWAHNDYGLGLSDQVIFSTFTWSLIELMQKSLFYIFICANTIKGIF